MADDTGFAGLSPDDLQELLKHLGIPLPSAEQNQREKIGAGLLGLSGQLLQARKGDGWAAAGRGLISGQNQMMLADENQRRNMLAQLQAGQMSQALKQQIGMQNAAAQYMTPASKGSPAMGPPTESGEMQPAVAPRPANMDWQGYQAAIAGINPQVAAGIDPFVRRQMAREALNKPESLPQIGAPPSMPPPNTPPPQGLAQGQQIKTSRDGIPYVANADGSVPQASPEQLASLGVSAPGAPPPLPPSIPNGSPISKGNTTQKVANKFMSDAQKLYDAGLQEEGDAKMAQAQKLLPTVSHTEKSTGPDGRQQLIPIYTTGEAGPPIPYTPPAPTQNEQAHMALDQKKYEEELRHHKALEGDPEMIESTAQGIVKGTIPPLSGWAMSKPTGQQVMARVTQLDPAFDPAEYGMKQKAEKDFGTGKQGQQVSSFNKSIAHLDTLSQAADAMSNGNLKLFNTVKNVIATQTGQPAPTNFEAIKQVVGNEIVKAIVGAGGGVGDREKAQDTINKQQSPAQLKGVIDQYKTLMGGQLDALKLQYEATTKKTDFASRYLSPEARKVMGYDSQSSDVRAQADAILSGR